MAKAAYKLPDDFLDRISKLADKTEEIVPRVLDAGGEVMAAQVRSNLASVVGSGTKFPSRSTGTLVSALGVSGARVDRNGNYNVKVGFAENRRDGVSNAMLANLLEHGKKGQPPKPFLRPARVAAKEPALAAMKAKLEEEIDKL